MPLCALGVCRACMPPMCALYVRLVHVPYVYALNVFRTCIPHLRCQQLRHVLMCTHVLMCMPCMCALYVFLQCVPYIHASQTLSGVVPCRIRTKTRRSSGLRGAWWVLPPLALPRSRPRRATNIIGALVCVHVGLESECLHCQNVCTVRMSAMARRSRWPLSPLSSSHFPHTARPRAFSPSLPLSLSLSLSINHTLSLSISFRGGKSGNGQGND